MAMAQKIGLADPMNGLNYPSRNESRLPDTATAAIPSASVMMDKGLRP